MNTLTHHNHPAGLPHGWWENEQLKIIVNMRHVFTTMVDNQGDTVESMNVTEQLVQAKHFVTALSQIATKAMGYLQQARAVLNAAEGNQARVQALLQVTRCSTDYTAIARLVTLGSGGWTKGVYKEINDQLRARKATMHSEFELSDLSEGRNGWLNLSDAMRERMHLCDTRTVEGNAVYHALQSLVVKHGLRSTGPLVVDLPKNTPPH